MNVRDIESMQEFHIEHFHDLSRHFICSIRQLWNWMAWSLHLPDSTCFTSKLASEAFLVVDDDDIKHYSFDRIS